MSDMVLTSVQVTACTPPNIVYTMAGREMATDVATMFQSSTSDSTTAGAEMIAPTDSPREIRNNRLVMLRTRASNRCSRYSYAVYTRAL